MLTEICTELRNFFSSSSDIHIGNYTISEGRLSPPVRMENGQYFRIVGSVFNDGVHRSDEILTDEGPFEGAVWLMRIPQDFLQLVAEMEAWQDKYGTIESPNMSPYSSESFGGYNYSKAQGFAGSGGGMLNTVVTVYGDRLRKYRKIRP